jgi:hypothetical protein
MKLFTVCVCGAIAGASLTAQAGTINLATGLDSSGNLYTTGDQLDANWTITNAGSYHGAVGQAWTVTPNQADWYGGWLANGPNSDWIAANPDSSYNGNLIATRTFDLTGAEVASAVFSNTAWTVDDSANLYLNGNLLGNQGGQWGSLQAVTIPTSDLVVGTNTLQIVGYNSDFYLEADRFEGTVSFTSTPSPAAALPMLAGIVGLVRRRRK